MVMKSFKTCGFLNVLDGTEDDELFTEEAEKEIEDDEAEDNEFGTNSVDESDADGE